MAQPQPLTTGWWHHAAMHHLSQGNRHGTRNLCVVPWRRRMYSLALKCHSSGSTGSPAVTTHTLPSAGLCKAAPCAALASAVLPPKAAYRTNSAPRVVLTATCNPAWWWSTQPTVENKVSPEVQILIAYGSAELAVGLISKGNHIKQEVCPQQLDCQWH